MRLISVPYMEVSKVISLKTRTSLILGRPHSACVTNGTHLSHRDTRVCIRV